MTTNRVNTFSLAGLFLVALVLTTGGCFDDGDGYVYGSAVGYDQTTQALSSGELEFVNGTYSATCEGHSVATDTWSVRVTGATALDYTVLTVVENDTSCVLTMTGLGMTGETIAATTPFALTASYGGSPLQYAFAGGEEFYADVKLSSVSFAADFVVQVVYSDDPALATEVVQGTFAVVATTATAGVVPAPDYTHTDNLVITTDFDDVVRTFTGSFDMSVGTVTAEYYAIVSGTVGNTYALIDAAYITEGGTVMSTSLAAALFTDIVVDTTDITTPVVSTVIVANIVDSVTSYQTFTLTFTAP